MLEECFDPGHRRHECWDDSGTVSSKGDRSHHIPTQRKSPKPQWPAEWILPRKWGRDRPHIPLNIPGNALSLGLTSDFINKGIITLILKSRDYYKLGNWRPITLLRSIHKILAKILVWRIEAYFPLMIRPNRTSFMMGRSILDNNFLA